MQRQHSELVPIGDALSGMGGPVEAIREASPQARHHFTRADQPARGQRSGPRSRFHGPHDGLCSLPRSNPGNRLQYKRVNGPYKLIMIAVGTTSSLSAPLHPNVLQFWLAAAGSLKRS